MFSSFEISSEKRAGAERHRSTLGNGSRRTRRNEDVPMRDRFATARHRATSVRQTTSVQNLRQAAAHISAAPGSEKAVAEKFASLVKQYSKNDLAEISGRTPEAAKHWKEASRAPNSASLLKIGRSIDAVRDWVADELGIEIQATAPNADKGAAAIAMLQAIALMPGEAGAMARASLNAIRCGGN